MTSIDPALEDRFVQILAGTRARAADITDRLAATKRQIAEESQQMRDSNERLCKELDEQSAARAAAQDDPAANNDWLKRAEAQDATFQFGDTAEPGYEPPVEPAERTLPPPTAEPGGRGRHSRRDDFDEDDYSNHNWLG